MRFQLGCGLMLSLLSFTALADVPNASAATATPTAAPLQVCALITNAEIHRIGYEVAGTPRSNGMDIKAAQSGAPTDMHSEMCFYYADAENSRKSVSLVVDRFAEIKGVADWLKVRSDASRDDKTLLSEVGDAICEEGEYSYAASRTTAPSERTVQYYVACDRLVDRHRVSISIEMPNQRNGLPSLADSKALLDLAIGRLPK